MTYVRDTMWNDEPQVSFPMQMTHHPWENGLIARKKTQTLFSISSSQPPYATTSGVQSMLSLMLSTTTAPRVVVCCLWNRDRTAKSRALLAASFQSRPFIHIRRGGKAPAAKDKIALHWWCAGKDENDQNGNNCLGKLAWNQSKTPPRLVMRMCAGCGCMCVSLRFAFSLITCLDSIEMRAFWKVERACNWETTGNIVGCGR